MMSRHENSMFLIAMMGSVSPISHTNTLSSRMRNTSASNSPICRARRRLRFGNPRDDDRPENDIVDAEHDFECRQRQ